MQVAILRIDVTFVLESALEENILYINLLTISQKFQLTYFNHFPPSVPIWHRLGKLSILI